MCLDCCLFYGWFYCLCFVVGFGLRFECLLGLFIVCVFLLKVCCVLDSFACICIVWLDLCSSALILFCLV